MNVLLISFSFFDEALQDSLSIFEDLDALFVIDSAVFLNGAGESEPPRVFGLESTTSGPDIFLDSWDFQHVFCCLKCIRLNNIDKTGWTTGVC